MLDLGNQPWAFDQHTCEEEIASFVDSIRQSPPLNCFLTALLPERLPLYANRSANEVIRIRGYILSAFEHVGLPKSAVPFVLEELESGRDAYLVAAAAKALRGLDQPTAKIIPFLFKAIENIKYADDSLTFDVYKPQWPIKQPTTALNEIFKTFEWLGAHATSALPRLGALCKAQGKEFSRTTRTKIEQAINRIRADASDVTPECCELPFGLSATINRFMLSDSDRSLVKDVEFEDQDGKTFKYPEFFSGIPSIVVFFYSRCGNPNKCSLTVTKLANLQDEIRKQGLDERIKTAAITYDPGYDLQSRLRAYGENRGIRFNNNNRFLRTLSGFRELQDYFRLGVNFFSSLVNGHRIELFIVDDHGEVVANFARLQWDAKEVLNRAKLLVEPNGDEREIPQPACKLPGLSKLSRHIGSGTLSALPPLVVAFFPKCPICWAAYLSVFGITGLQNIPYSPWLRSAFGLLMLVNLLSIFKRSRKRYGDAAFYISLLGNLVLLVSSMKFQPSGATYIGIAMIFGGALLSSRSSQAGLSLKAFVSRMRRRVSSLPMVRNRG